MFNETAWWLVRFIDVGYAPHCRVFSFETYIEGGPWDMIRKFVEYRMLRFVHQRMSMDAWLWGRLAAATLSGQWLKLHGCFFVTFMLASDIDLMIWFCCCWALDVHRGWHLSTAHRLRTVHFALTQLYVVTTVDDAVSWHYIARIYLETFQRWTLLADRVGGLWTISDNIFVDGRLL